MSPQRSSSTGGAPPLSREQIAAVLGREPSEADVAQINRQRSRERPNTPERVRAAAYVAAGNAHAVAVQGGDGRPFRRRARHLHFRAARLHVTARILRTTRPRPRASRPRTRASRAAHRGSTRGSPGGDGEPPGGESEPPGDLSPAARSLLEGIRLLGGVSDREQVITLVIDVLSLWPEDDNALVGELERRGYVRDLGGVWLVIQP